MNKPEPDGVERPLTGLRVLDLTRLLPGPYCTLLLANLGATVIKLEDRAGDPMRAMPPCVDGVGAVFQALNRGKQSVVLDLKQVSGREIAQELAAGSDIVVEGFRPGTVDRLGMDFRRLADASPRLVYCSISGYGQEGAWRGLPGHDLTYAATAGLLDVLSPGSPRVPGVQLADAAVALLAAVRILAALQARDRGPQYLDVSLVDGAQALMPGAFAELAAPPEQPSVMELLRGSERNNVYRCADGRWLAVSPLEDRFWQRLLETLRSEDLLDAAEIPTASTLHAIFAQRAAGEWFELLSGADVPCAPVKTVREAMPAEVDREPAPRLGEHTRFWLERMGYSPDDITRLHDDGVAYSAHLSSHGG